MDEYSKNGGPEILFRLFAPANTYCKMKMQCHIATCSPLSKLFRRLCVKYESGLHTAVAPRLSFKLQAAAAGDGLVSGHGRPTGAALLSLAIADRTLNQVDSS